MKEEIKITKLKLVLLAAIFLVAFAYGTYFLWSKISSSRALYLSKYNELVSIEKKQELVEQIQQELIRHSEDKEAVLQSLVSRDETLDFIIRLEDIARKAGLSYDAKILRELTEESIEKEILTLKRSRAKRTQEITRARQKLPSIVFGLDLEGSYSGVVRFMEGIASLPYYTHIETFNISNKEESEEGVGGVEAIVQIIVFTKN